MEFASSLVILDRDGVLNRMVIHPEHGLIDSPLIPEEVDILPGVPEALAQLSRCGYQLGIATNQPAAAKGKTTRENLERVHARVLLEIQRAGGRIASSRICYHRAEDGCACRKPGTAMLEELLTELQFSAGHRHWMVGDGVTDIEAGAKLGLQTAFLGPRKTDAQALFEERGISPTYWGGDLKEFVAWLTGLPNNSRG